MHNPWDCAVCRHLDKPSQNSDVSFVSLVLFYDQQTCLVYKHHRSSGNTSWGALPSNLGARCKQTGPPSLIPAVVSPVLYPVSFPPISPSFGKKQIPSFPCFPLFQVFLRPSEQTCINGIALPLHKIATTTNDSDSPSPSIAVSVPVPVFVSAPLTSLCPSLSCSTSVSPLPLPLSPSPPVSVPTVLLLYVCVSVSATVCSIFFKLLSSDCGRGLCNHPCPPCSMRQEFHSLSSPHCNCGSQAEVAQMLKEDLEGCYSLNLQHTPWAC